MGAESSKAKDPNDISLNLRGLYGYQNVVVHTAQVLGSGAYGNVVKAMLDHQSCAAKILHRLIVDSQDPGVTDFISRFEQECQILQELQHPNIVSFLGVVADPSTKKPILLMELMEESLTHFLESSSTDVPYYVQVNISHDIALAVAHLHGNRIFHRDLSSNNILLNADCQAKVTDFGMSKFAASNPSITRSKVTQCPGTPVYMPPEALRPQPRYSDKIDSFSIGVLLLQITTRNYPAPTAASTTREDPSSAWGEIDIPIPEVDRRKSDIDKVPAFHGFLPVIIECLKDKSKHRPTAAQLCQSLGQLKNTAAYRESIGLLLFEGKMELHDAAERGDVEEVQRLLSTSVDINSRTKDEGDTALHLACKSGLIEVVHLLIRAQAALDIADKDGRTPLLWASFKGHRAVVQLLLKNGADVSICHKDGLSPVYAASWGGNTDVADLLVIAGANVNQTCTKEPYSAPLGKAAEKGHPETVKRLLEAGANPNYQNKSGQTPVFSASWKGHRAVVQLLIENGANVHICKENGVSPVYAASHEGHTDVVDILVKAGANIDQAYKTGIGGVPLGVAAEKGHTETVTKLIEAGVTVNYQNNAGCTALLYAGWKGHSEVVKLLLGAGARDIPDKFGNTAMSKARANNHNGVVQCLMQHQNDA